MSNDAPDSQPTTTGTTGSTDTTDTTDTSDTSDTGDTATADFDAALIPQETDEAPLSQSANRAKADANPETEPASTGAGDKNTDPNAQPPA